MQSMSGDENDPGSPNGIYSGILFHAQQFMQLNVSICTRKTNYGPYSWRKR